MGMTGWIRLTRRTDDSYIYISVDHIQAVCEELGDFEDGTYTKIDMVTGEFEVKEPVEDVLKKIRLARPVRT